MTSLRRPPLPTPLIHSRLVSSSFCIPAPASLRRLKARALHSCWPHAAARSPAWLCTRELLLGVTYVPHLPQVNYLMDAFAGETPVPTVMPFRMTQVWMPSPSASLRALHTSAAGARAGGGPLMLIVTTMATIVMIMITSALASRTQRAAPIPARPPTCAGARPGDGAVPAHRPVRKLRHPAHT